MFNKKFYRYIVNDAKTQKKLLSRLYLNFLNSNNYINEEKHAFEANELIKLEDENFAAAMDFISRKNHYKGEDDCIMNSQLDELKKLAAYEIIKGI